MPYTPTTWTQGVTPLNATNMNNLDGPQYTEATNSFEQDLFSAFVHSGLAVTRHNSYSSNVLADTPLRYYRLDEVSGTSAFDSSGNGQVATLNGGYTQGVAGALKGDPDTALTLNGTTGYVSCPTSGLPTGNAAVTLEGWFQFAAVGTAMAIAGYGDSAMHQALTLYLDATGKLNADVFNTGAVTSPSAVSTGAWHHAACTWDGTTLRLYLDGASVGTPTTPGAQSIPGSPVLRLGANSNSSIGLFFNGSIDEAAVYSGALSAARVSAHYTAGTSFTTQVDMASGIAFPQQADNTLRRRSIAGASFTTVTPSTTYFLYAQPDGTTYWNTANTPAANSLALAQVTTDGSGNVSVVTDKRALSTVLLPAAVAGAFPRVVAQAVNVPVAVTTLQTILSYTPTVTGLYRLNLHFSYGNNSTQAVWGQASYTDPNLGAPTVTFTEAAGGKLVNGTNTFTANTSHATLPITVYAKAGAPIVIVYQDTAGTPNDFVSALIERLA